MEDSEEFSTCANSEGELDHFESENELEDTDNENEIGENDKEIEVLNETEDEIQFRMEIDEEEENPTWNQIFDPNVEEFEEPDGKIADELEVTRMTSPLQLARKFLTDDIIEDIVTESNRFVAQVKEVNNTTFNKWKLLTLAEFWRFVALVITMGLVKKSAMKDYWSTDPFFSTPFFAQVMSRDRFLDILRSSHVVNNKEVRPGTTDGFHKLGTFMTDLLTNFKAAIKPGRELCVDESLLGYKGRLSFKQYNPKKRARFGIKFVMFADCDSKFILDILPYQGKSTFILDKNWIKDLGFGGAAYVTLLQTYLHKCHRVIADNWFMSQTLARKLLEAKTYLLCTVQKKRKDMPKNTKTKLRKGAVETYSNGCMLVERWMDRREVCMLNTFVEHGMTESQSSNPNNNRLKPNNVLLYK